MHRKRPFFLWFIVLALALATVYGQPGTASAGVTLYVATNGDDSASGSSWDAPFLTISNALKRTGDGVVTNVVMVSNGTYVMMAQLSVTNGVTLRSLTGNPADVTINGNYPTKTNRCISVQHAGAVVLGLTFTNGCSTAGGGGVSIGNGFISNCVFTGNRSISAYGGAIYMTGGRLESCVISDNTNNYFGGGMYVTGGTVKNSSILDNDTFSGGGGMWIGGVAAVSNCVIAGNRNYRSDEGGGGGVYVRDSSGAGPRFANCLIVSNYTAKDGGGIFFYANGTGTFENCTIASNYAVNYAGGAFSYVDSRFRNTIIYHNLCGVSPGSYGNINGAAPWSFTNCCSSGVAMPGANNTTADPQYVNKDTGDFRLKPNSPCINTGTNDAWMAGATDLDGHRRQDAFSGRVDMGAYEFLRQGTMFMLR